MAEGNGSRSTKTAAPQRRAASRLRVAPPAGAHEWLSFPDEEEDRTWLIDITFLLSDWRCIFGQGCQGVLTGPAPELVQGCCSYGAHFVDEEDLADVEKVAATLADKEWQFAAKGRTAKGKPRIARTDKDGALVSRLVDGACIFLNRPGFAAGAGCALHAAALSRGQRPLDFKPDVCWQLPLRRLDETDATGHVTSTIEQWDRRHWGEGGFEFHWWCTEAPEAFTASEPVFLSMRDELIELVGAHVYATIAAELGRRGRKVASLTHPAAPGPTHVTVGPPKRRKG